MSPLWFVISLFTGSLKLALAIAAFGTVFGVLGMRWMISLDLDGRLK